MPDRTPSMPPLPEASAWEGNYSGRWCALPMGRRQAEALLSNGQEVRPLFTADQVQAVADERVREALERAAKLCDAERAEFMEQAGHNNGRQSDMAFGSVNSAERLAGAIRALALPTLSIE